jgi:hypothetical protein
MKAARDEFNFFMAGDPCKSNGGEGGGQIGKRRIWVVQSWNLLSLNTNTWY